MTYEDITVAVEEGVAVITINRPDRANKLRFQTARELLDAFRDVRADPQLDVAVLTGAGEKFFCIGGEHDDARPRWTTRRCMPMIDLYEFIDTMPKPVIAAVNGFAVGGGNVLPGRLRPHHRRRARRLPPGRPHGRAASTRATAPGTSRTRSAASGPRRCGTSTRSTPPSEALAMGLVNEVVPATASAGRARVEVGPGARARGARSPSAALKTAFSGRPHRRRRAGPDGPRPAPDRLPADGGVRRRWRSRSTSAAPRTARSCTDDRAGRRARPVPRGPHHVAEQAPGAGGALERSGARGRSRAGAHGGGRPRSRGRNVGHGRTHGGGWPTSCGRPRSSRRRWLWYWPPGTRLTA